VLRGAVSARSVQLHRLLCGAPKANRPDGVPVTHPLAVFCHVTFDVDLLQSERANRARPPIARGTALAQIIHEGIGANLDRMTNDQGSREHSTHPSPSLRIAASRHWSFAIGMWSFPQNRAPVFANNAGLACLLAWDSGSCSSHAGKKRVDAFAVPTLRPDLAPASAHDKQPGASTSSTRVRDSQAGAGTPPL